MELKEYVKANPKDKAAKRLLSDMEQMAGIKRMEQETPGEVMSRDSDSWRPR